MEEERQPTIPSPEVSEEDIEILHLVGAQSLVKETYEDNWKDSGFSSTSLLRRVLKEIPLSDKSKETIKFQVLNLMEAREKILKIVKSGKSRKELFKEAFPEFKNPPAPINMVQMPYSLHFEFTDRAFQIITNWAISRHDYLAELPRDEKSDLEVGGLCFHSGNLGIYVSASKKEEGRASEAHELMHGFLNVIFPGEDINWEKFYSNFDYAILCLKSSAQDELISYAEEHRYLEISPSTKQFLRSLPVVAYLYKEIQKCYRERAKGELRRFKHILIKNFRVVDKYSPGFSVLLYDYAPLVAANLEFGEISERFPKIAKIFKGIVGEAFENLRT